MRCSKCGSDNREGRKFCVQCGQALKLACPSCGASSEPGERFCGDCGAPLSQPTATVGSGEHEAALSTVEQEDPRQRLEGARRHLTVLFCDLVGSTEIASQLDPEEWREVVRGYHRAAAEAIERFGGSVAQYLGDGVMAYFGYPAAHDNDAECAVHAGLAILDAISKLNEQPERPRLAARVGIDSGAVVVGAGAGKEADVFGGTPNIAARVQAVAEAGTVLITDASHLLVSGHFVLEDRGSPALKGVDRPVRLYRVIQPSGVHGRLEAAAAARGLTPFVGREDELSLLMNRWERVLDGEGQVVVIVGEAGIGKSRLMRRFHEQIAAERHTWVDTATAPLFQNTPFYPFVENVRNIIAGRGEGSAEHPLVQLEPRLKLAGLNLSEALPLFASLLGLPPPAKYPSLRLSPEQQRRRLLATLVEWAVGHARVQPLVLAIEDLHWADPSTIEMLQVLVEQVATARLLLLTTARPEFRVPWPTRAHHTQITLNRLRRRNARKLIAQVAVQRVLPQETLELLVERSGGVPLFIEELTRAVLESDNPKLTRLEIPVTLHDSLMARLDRMGPAKEVAQLGAVIGSEFSYELLHAIHPIAEDDLERALRNLADAEMLYVRGSASEANYLFKHALIRDAAYEALLKSRRKELHRLVASTIEEKFAALKESRPEILARHWTEAGETERAIVEWSRAGKAAETRYAFMEALESYQQALALLSLSPKSPERDRRESELRGYEYYLKGRSKFFESWGSTSTMKAARELFTKAVEIDPTYARAYTGLADCDAFLWINGDSAISYTDLLAISSKALGLAPDMAEAHSTRGIALFVGGRADEAEAAFERAIKLDPLLFDAHFFSGINCRNRGDFDRAASLLERAAELRSDDFASLTLLANVYELQGRAELSRQTARRSLIRIESTLKQRPDAPEVLGVGAATLVYLGENARAMEWARRAVSLEPSNHTVRYNAACTYAVIGEVDAALEQLEYILSQVPRARPWLLKIIKNDPQFDSLRSRVEFQSFMRRLEEDADLKP
jgi:class 3 adenylate cyclase/tetratricopeptide (TPR) repeat protein